jgi:hypothetical protein
MKKIGAALSILLHLSLLIYFIDFQEKYPKVEPIPDAALPLPVEVRLLPYSDPSIGEIKPDEGLEKIKYPSDGRICNGKDKFYKGIGIIYNPGSFVIIYAPEYYPAYKAGLRIGDRIVDPDIPEIDGYVDIEINRGYSIEQFHIKTDNICFNEE